MAPLNVVCLISGGKDSFFSILHCLKNGHEVVALANLHPPADRSGDRVDDLDSYMYQTIGHAVIPLYEQAVGLPLYRQEISGTHVNHDRSYGPPAAGEDETEALVPLLHKVKAAHPEVNAVSTGAILSDYQRTRVESVAIRLGLTPLAYLWQWPNLPPHTQSSLLEDMATVGQDSRIVKVASGGLDESFLWKNVGDLHTIKRLEKAASRFGSPGDGATLGEGGEYETLAVAGPAPPWKGRIVVSEDENTVVSSGAGAAYLQPANARFEPSTTSTGSITALRTPPLLESQFETLLNTLNERLDSTPVPNEEPRMAMSQSDAMATSSDHMLLSGLTGEGLTPAQQTAVIMDNADELFRSSGHSIGDIVYTSIILRDMGDFASINAVYGSYFQHPNPPARLTLACAGVLQEGKDVMISLTSVKKKGLHDRKGLHVQSRSYWAPANIGPYSQAMTVPLESDEGHDDNSLVYIAGQIPLVPCAMDLPGADSHGSQPFTFETVLALQHYIRISRITQVRKCAAAIAFITASSPDDAHIRCNVARQAWEGLHRLETAHAYEKDVSDSDSESFDVWDVKFGNAKRSDKHLASLGDPSTREYVHMGAMPPLYVIQVEALPRGAGIEWATYGLTNAERSRPHIAHLEHLLEAFKQQVLYTDLGR